MRQTNALKRKLEDLTEIFHPDGKRIPIKFVSNQNPHADINGEYIAVWTNVSKWIGKSNLSKADEMRILTSVVSHEVEHFVQSDLKGKKKFMEKHPEAPETAGFVYNAFEDVYVDFSRTSRWRGHRVKRAFLVTKALSNSYRHPSLTSIDSEEEQLAEGMLQTCLRGYPKGITDLDNDTLVQFFGYCRAKMEQIKQTPEHEDRVQIYEEIYQRLIDIVGEPETLEGTTGEAENPYSVPVDKDSLDFEEIETDEDSMEQADDLSVDINGEDTKSEGESFEEDGNDTGESGKNDGSDEEAESESGETGEFPDNDDLVSDDDLPGDDASGDESSESDEKGENEDMPEAETVGGQAPITEFIEDEKDVESEGEEQGDESGSQERGEEEGIDESEPINGGACERDEASETGDHRSDADEWRDIVEEMKEADEEGKTFDWYDIDTDSEGFEEPSERDRRRLEIIQEETHRENTSLGEKRQKRDEHARDFDIDEQKIYETLRKKGIEDEITGVFEELKSDYRDIPVPDGPDIHMQNAIRYFCGDYTEDNLYSLSLPVETGDRSVSVAVDLSISVPEHEIKVALLGLQRACETIGDQFMACGFKTFNTESGHNVQYTPLITGPHEEFRLEHLSAVFSGGRTPLAAGIVQANDLLEEGNRKEKVIIVLTDGEPNVGIEAGRHGEIIGECSDIIDGIRQEKTTVIGIGFGNVKPQKMEEMFGEDGYVMGTVENLADRLLEVYLKQMNVLDLHRDYKDLNL